MSEASAPTVSGDRPAEVEPNAVKEGRVFRSRLGFWLPVAPLVALDLWSKWFCFRLIDEMGRTIGPPVNYSEPAIKVWDGWISFHLVKWYNTGTLWGLFRDHNTPLRILRCLAVVVIIYLAIKTPSRLKAQLFALGLVLAGAIGNLWDNFSVGPPEVLKEQTGGVRDFLLFTFGTYNFPAFNVADSCISVGAVLLLYLLVFQPVPKAADQVKAANASSP